MGNVPKDPVMLLSFVNLKLRDFYSSPQAMCEDLDINLDDLNKTLSAINYEYDADKNQYV